MRIDNGRYREVVMDWSNIALPLKAGTPISAAGAVANNGNAIGLVPDKVIAQTPMPRSIFILDAGDVDLAEVEAESGLTLTNICKDTLTAIRFHKANGKVEGGTYYTPGNGIMFAQTLGSDESRIDLIQVDNIPASTATTVEGLVTDFNALLAALKEAGHMEADPEEVSEGD